MNGMQRLGRRLGVCSATAFHRGRTIMGPAVGAAGASNSFLSSTTIGRYSITSSRAVPVLLQAAKNIRCLSSSSSDTTIQDSSDESDEWIPPSRPLAGDKGQSHVYAHVRDKGSLKGEQQMQQEQELDQDTAEHKSTNSSSSSEFTAADDNDDEWIPPERPLAGDEGQSHAYAHVEEKSNRKRLEMELRELDVARASAAAAASTSVKQQQQQQQPIQTTNEASSKSKQSTAVAADPFDVPDWLKTRRRRLEGTDLVKPQDAARAKQQKLLSDLPVLQHTLLTAKEIVTVIEAMGGQDVACVLDNWDDPRMGGALGVIVATGANHAQIRTLAESLLRQLRLRQLQDLDVTGAKEGIEGNVGDPYEDWLVLDCENYVVHFQTPSSRQALNLVGLWSGQDGMHQLDLSNEDAVDDFIAANPVPEWYNAGASPVTVDWDKKVRELKKGKFVKKPARSGGGRGGGFRLRQRGRRR